MRKTVILLCLLLMAGMATRAQSDMQRPRIGVVLGGGGAKGAAHIGALKYLEEQGIPVDYVTGTSMGSIIGGLYALGYTPDEMAEIIGTLDWSRYMTSQVDPTTLTSRERQLRTEYLLQIPFSLRNADEALSSQEGLRNTIISSLPSSFVGGTNVTNLFNNLSIGYQDSMSYDSLPIPFACVATDILTGDAYIMHSGHLPLSMRASMAIPGVFDPVKIDGHLLLDGGMVNNFPTDICREMGADIIIGIEVAQELDSSTRQLQSLPQIANQLMQIAVKNKKIENRQLCDIYIRPDMTGYNMLSFNRAAIDTLVMRGYVQAASCGEQIAELRERLDQYGPHPKRLQRAPAHYLGQDTVCIVAVDCNEDGYEKTFEKSKLVPGVMTGTEIEKATQRVVGTGTVSSLAYGITPVECGNDTLPYPCYQLHTTLQPAVPHIFAAGLRYDSEESASVLLALGLNQHHKSGFKMMISTRLNYNSRFSVRGTYEGVSAGNINLQYYFQEDNYHIHNKLSTVGNGYRQDHSLRLYISEVQSSKVNLSIGGQEELVHFIQSTSSESLQPASFVKKYYGFFGRMVYDNRNKNVMASRGTLISISSHWRIAHGSGFTPEGTGFGDVLLSIKSNHTLGAEWLTGSPQLYTRLTTRHGNDNEFHTLFGGTLANRYMQGHLPFIGITDVQNTLADAAVLRYDLRWNVVRSHYLSLLVNAIGGTTGSLFDSDSDSHFKSYYGLGLQYSLRSVLGLVAVDLHWSTLTNRIGAFLSIGYDI